ncbi:hypothetical protein JW978_03650 [Candidatus Dojkabacteria bacterium]|nr:hypothetical protein [Candidatus Dojkabacteria bacterium]
MQKSSKIIILFLYIVFSCLLVLAIAPPYWLNLLIVYLPPTVVNLVWLKKDIRIRLILFAILTTFLFAIPIEIISRLANAWDVASSFPRILNIAPLENIFYAFINFLWPIAFYEYFIDKGRNKKINNRFSILLILYIALFVGTFMMFAIDKTIITLDYWVVGAIVLLTPLICFSIQGRIEIKRLIFPTLFFGFVFFIHEIVSLELGHWWWPGEYLLETTILGNRFPIDDVLIWYVISTPTLIMGYEFFVDDNR